MTFICPRCQLEFAEADASEQAERCEFCRERWRCWQTGERPPEVPTDRHPAGRRSVCGG